MTPPLFASARAPSHRPLSRGDEPAFNPALSVIALTALAISTILTNLTAPTPYPLRPTSSSAGGPG